MHCHQVVLALLPVVFVILIGTSDAKQPKLVTQFRENFEQRVHSDPNLKKIFTTNGLTAQEAANEFHKRIYEHSQTKLDPTVSSRAIKNHWDIWTQDNMIKAYGQAAGDSLLVLGQLNSTNVQKWSNDYVDGFAESVNSSYVENDPKTIVKCLVSGYGGFFDRNGLYTKENSALVGVLYANDVYYN